MEIQDFSADDAVADLPVNFAVWASRRGGCILARLAILTAMALPVWPQQNPADLTDRSLEDLMNIEVTSVSKKGQKLSHTAAAIFVISQEDIRRSGSTSIPGTNRKRAGIFVEPERRISSWEITKMAAAVWDSFCPFFETEVTSMFIRSSRLRSVRSAGFCCGQTGRAIAVRIARRARMHPPRRLAHTAKFTGRSATASSAEKSWISICSRPGF